MGLVGEFFVGAVILVGVLGTVVPMVPGPSLVLAAIVVWAWIIGGWAWAVAGVAAGLIVGAALVKYLVAGAGMKRAGITNRTIVIGGVAGVIGFFVIPVIGLPIGFLAGAAASEFARTRDPGRGARGAVAAVRAAGVAILIELTASLFAAGSWLIGAVAL